MTHPKAVGGDGQVEQPLRVPADLLLGSSHSRDQRGRVVQVGGAEGQGVLERAPGLTDRLGGAELGDGIVGIFLEAGLRDSLGASRAHDAVALGQQASRGQVEQPGSSFRLARSPVAPKSTMTWLPGRLRCRVVANDVCPPCGIPRQPIYGGRAT
jgi:hypothetical protein